MSELSSLLELLGPDTTLKIVEQYGGTRVYVPDQPRATHELRELLGDTGFSLLVQYFGASMISVPMARKWRFDVYAKMGLTYREIARRTGCTERAVYAHRRRREVPGQQELSFNNLAEISKVS